MKQQGLIDAFSGKPTMSAAELKEKKLKDKQMKEARQHDLQVDQKKKAAEEEFSWEDLADDTEMKEKEQQKKEQEELERQKTIVEDKLKKQIDYKYRAPILCVLGHVDTGKTKILDRIRRTNVQDAEAGGITQQIGATFVPIEALVNQTKAITEKQISSGQKTTDFQIPGLLIIDTPGHSSFTNLRSRGSSLCDISILVVDILHGLENQTLESLNLLRSRKTPFIVALNKVDTLSEWKSYPNSPIQESLKLQGAHTLRHYEEKVKETIGLFAQQGINAAIYYDNKDPKSTLSLVPTSAITGEGIPDMLMLMTQLTQQHLSSKIEYTDKLQCTVLEVKVVGGLGTTMDVILAQGKLRTNDTVVVCSLNGPVVTTVRSLLTPKPLREIRVKGDFIQYKEIKAAQGIKICAQGLDTVIPGSPLYVYDEKSGEKLEDLKEEVMRDLNSLLSHVSRVDKGVSVQSSTLGSLESLLGFLEESDIPVMGINIGPVHKKDVVKASVVSESNPELAVILAFDVPVTKEANEAKDKFGVTIYSAEIIYHLVDSYKKHMERHQEKLKKEAAGKAIWPCILKIIACFHMKSPVTLGVDVVEGKLKIGTPLSIIQEDGKELELGRVSSIQFDKVSKLEASRGSSVAIQLDSSNKNLQYGKHFDDKLPVYSRMTRDSIDLLKTHFANDLQQSDKELIQELKKVLNIPDPFKISSLK